MNKCSLCKSTLIKSQINFPTFRHYDFKTVSKKTTLSFCNKCKIFYSLKKHYIHERKIFNSKNYADTQKFFSRKIFNNENNKKFLSRVDTQIEILKDKLQQSASILEVGCNNGELLYKIKKEFKNLSIFGSDTEIFKKFYRKSGITFISSTNQNKISRLKFDVIIFSQSIYYLNPKIILKYLNLLNFKGTIYIEIPNFNVNPYSILMSDVCFVPFVESIKNILSLANLKMKILKNTDLRREIVIIAKKKIFKNKKENINLNKYLKILNLSKKKTLNLDNLRKDYLVFGNTCKAAFIDEISSNCKSFVTNYPVLKKFRNKKNLKMKNNIKDIIIFPDKRIMNNQKKLKLITKKTKFKVI